MTTWWWVRHGPTHSRALIGWSDLPADLSDGAAIAWLDGYLPRDALVISSDLVRASATADTVSAGRTRLDNTPDLRELNFGLWEGKTFAEAAKSHPDQASTYWSKPGDTRAPDGESWNDTEKRVSAFVDRMNIKYCGKNIIAVAHFGVILTQLGRAAGMPAQAAFSFKIDNLSVTCLQFLDPDWRVLGVNHTA